MTRTKLIPTSRRKQVNPLDRAAGWELVWQEVSPVFEAFRPIRNPSYVYFIGEEDDGAVKIGSALDPILRLRGLQTGNPRRLRIERVLVGDEDLERLMHELWEPFAIKSKRAQGKVDVPMGTEWFTADIREQLYPILETAAEGQIECMTTPSGPGEILMLEVLERKVREAHTAHGFVAKGRDEVRQLAAGPGYVVRRPSRI